MPKSQKSTHADPRPDAPGPSEPTFEAALEQVESIIERIEAGEVGLEQSLAEYEQGIKLISLCRSRLEHAQQRVVDLTKRLSDADKPSAPSAGT